MHTLQAEVNGLEKQAEKAQEDARTAVRQGQRSKAMQHLKKKHLYEAQLRKKAVQHDNIEAMLMKLQDLPAQRKVKLSLLLDSDFLHFVSLQFSAEGCL